MPLTTILNFLFSQSNYRSNLNNTCLACFWVRRSLIRNIRYHALHPKLNVFDLNFFFLDKKLLHFGMECAEIDVSLKIVIV